MGISGRHIWLIDQKIEEELPEEDGVEDGEEGFYEDAQGAEIELWKSRKMGILEQVRRNLAIMKCQAPRLGR